MNGLNCRYIKTNISEKLYNFVEREKIVKLKITKRKIK